MIFHIYNDDDDDDGGGYSSREGEDGYGVMMFYCLIKFKEILHF
jgi:hypothetical protein